jgi:hypothetical protein
MSRRQRRPTVTRRSTRDAAADLRADRRHHPPRPPPGAIRGSTSISASARIRRAAARRAATTWRRDPRRRGVGGSLDGARSKNPAKGLSGVAEQPPACRPWPPWGVARGRLRLPRASRAEARRRFDRRSAGGTSGRCRGLASGSSTASRRPLELKEGAGSGMRKDSTGVVPALRRDRDTHMEGRK